MVEETVKVIREIEDKATEIISKAEENGKNLISKAENDAATLKDKALSDANDDAEEQHLARHYHLQDGRTIGHAVCRKTSNHQGQSHPHIHFAHQRRKRCGGPLTGLLSAHHFLFKSL